MPTYEYRCDNGHEYSETRSITQNQIKTICTECGLVFKQNYNAPLIQLKGTGFYRNSRK